MTLRPDRTEAADYYFKYIDLVEGDDICRILRTQETGTLDLLQEITEQQSLHRYAPGKWSIREVLGHINDTERLFVFRAFWFARGFDSALPSFDQQVAASVAGAAERSWASHVDEWRTVRASTISFFDHLPPDAWARRGIASDNPFTVKALAYLAAGHVIHHSRILREQYREADALRRDRSPP